MGKVDLAGKLHDARARVDAETPPADRGVPKFARLTRKDARVRADQDVALTALVKQLMKRRTVKAERITENTLIRVAIDLLLAHADDLRGSTEDELRRSVTTGLPDSASPELAKPGCAAVSTFERSAPPEFRASASVGSPRGVPAPPPVQQSAGSARGLGR